MKPTNSKLLTANNIAGLVFTLVMTVVLVANVNAYAHALGAAHHDAHCTEHNN